MPPDPRPEGACTRTPVCNRKKGDKCDFCKSVNAWYQREWRRRNSETAKRKDRFYRQSASPEQKDQRRAYMERYNKEKREQIQAKRLETYWADPEAARELRRKYYYQGKYGITMEQRDALMDGTCPICMKRPKAHVDHDHETGSVRGGLCMTCNTALGWVEEVGLDAISRYLSIARP